MTPEVRIDDSADALVASTAHALLALLAQRVEQAGHAHLCLTGGTIAARLYRHLGTLPSSLDWTKVHLWWGDERWVPADHADRNDRAAREALGSQIWERAQRHPMPAADAGTDLSAAAVAYRDELGAVTFDVCLLGMGPDGHVASLFPEHPSLQTPGRVIPVSDSPKPPPERLSLTMPVINRAEQVWLLVSGAEKAVAVADALGADSTLPAAQVEGRTATVWRLDRDAAGSLPDRSS